MFCGARHDGKCPRLAGRTLGRGALPAAVTEGPTQAETPPALPGLPPVISAAPDITLVPRKKRRETRSYAQRQAYLKPYRREYERKRRAIKRLPS